jgi:hypothetical protein
MHPSEPPVRVLPYLLAAALLAAVAARGAPLPADPGAASPAAGPAPRDPARR